MLSLDDQGMTLFQEAQSRLRSEAERTKFTTLFVNFVCAPPRLIKPDLWQVEKAINQAYSELGIACGREALQPHQTQRKTNYDHHRR